MRIAESDWKKFKRVRTLALEFIEDDELVDVTPGAIRIRKPHLKEQERKRAGRAAG